MEREPSVLGDAARFREGAISAAALTDAALAAIAGVPSLNAFAAVHEARARERAAALDRQRTAGEPGGPLAGVPVAVKDNIDQAGVVCAAACAAYRDRVPGRDAAVVTRLEDAGAVIVGRTNMHELADGVTSEDSWYGPVINPWRPGFHAGGSSGGSAAAVAAGCVAAALGSDTGGSVRIPASLCGVVGYKPSAGLVPGQGVVPLSTTLDTIGVLARRVRDAAAVIEVLAGGEGPGLGPACERGAAGLRVGEVHGFGLSPAPEIAAQLAAVGPLLEQLGCERSSLEIPALARGVRLLARIYAPEFAAWHAPALAERPDDFGPAVRADLERSLALDPARREQALQERAALIREVAQAMQSLDLLVCATTVHPARPLGGAPPPYLALTSPFNISGQPAISISLGLCDGLPVGLQIVGKAGGDTDVLRLAAALEARIGFAVAPAIRAP